METYIFTSTLREFLRPRRILPWLVVAVVVWWIAFVFHGMSPSSSRQDDYVLLSSTFVFHLLALCAAIFSTAIVAQEVEQRTIVYLLTRPVERWKLLVFRSLAAMLVVFGISLVTVIGVSYASVGKGNPLLLRDIEALAAGSAAYISLFVFVSLLMNRSMILCLLFAFIWETAVPNMPGDLYRLTITSYLSSIAQKPTPQTPGGFLSALGGLLGINTIAPVTAWISMGLLTAICLAAGAYWFGHFEYMAREDAE
jgi:ABC-2 type transport system permease protein